ALGDSVAALGLRPRLGLSSSTAAALTAGLATAFPALPALVSVSAAGALLAADGAGAGAAFLAGMQFLGAG
ncbi:MAG: hypothetical protein ACK520_06695, partial [Inhella sp.]